MESKVSNGSGPQDERITNLLVFGFLQNCSNYNLHEELELLGHELPVPTDGNRCSYFLDEDRRKHLAAVLEQAMQTYPKDTEKEKTMLMLAMLLAKKVADHTPSLLCDVFHTIMNFISQNLLTYVRNLVRNEMD
uniref:BH3-interacting domain death agonist n=1 Tax=Canis lupus familiaris TaxID=9615 RepID=A0A8P0PMX0_CANLF